MTLSALYAHADRMRGNGAPARVEKREPTPEMLRWKNAVCRHNVPGFCLRCVEAGPDWRIDADIDRDNARAEAMQIDAEAAERDAEVD